MFKSDTGSAMTHSVTIQRLLTQGDRINTIQAYHVHGIPKVSAIIAALRKNGWAILSRRIVAVNGMGENRVVNEYWIKDKPKPRKWDKQEVR